MTQNIALQKSLEPSALSLLEKRTGASWPNIRAAKALSTRTYSLLEDALGEFTNSDSSIFVVGSLARQEFTIGSDIDWALLLDGISHPNHLKVAHAIRNKIRDASLNQPGTDGVFGTLVSSHDLINNIGGQDDTNANTTLRILLLLESLPIGRSDAYDRVFNGILFRYLDEDRGLWHGSGCYKVPRFMFNDVARYWRTVTVDFACKQRNRQNVGFAIRNLKLRMSRKLIFLAGMVACFECHAGFTSDEERVNFYAVKQVQPVIERLRITLAKTPLEIVATALVRHVELDLHSKQLFNAYDQFLGMLADETFQSNGKTIRDHLNLLAVDELGSDEVATKGREVSHQFRDAIRAIFLNNHNELGKMTIEYGVF